MTEAHITVDRHKRSARHMFDVINPATGGVFGEAPECTWEQLDHAFDRAREAQVSWRDDDGVRRECLGQAAEALEAASDEIAPILTAEQGRPLRQAAEEVHGASLWLRYFAELMREPELIQDDAAARVEVHRRPLGVVVAITPWNYPLILACWKIAPALRAGNTVVLKPSPYTPLSTLKMTEVINGTLPPGVLQAVAGGDQLGRWMTSHPVPRKISFTGSIGAGKDVAVAAAPELKRVTLELGGNDAAIVLDDADPVVIAPKLFDAAFLNNGQVCSAIKRLYVAERLYPDLVAALTELAQTAKVGDPMLPDTDLGPINNEPQFERVKQLVAEAISNGGKAATGGSAMDRPGYFFLPTIVTKVAEGTRLVDEEQFGPALPVMSYRTLDEAVQRANATDYGLSGSVWSSDPDRAAEAARRLECGTTWVNTHLALAPHQPFGGIKSSGVGVENGPWGLAAFSEIHVQHTAK